jgi:hypothetical protein
MSREQILGMTLIDVRHSPFSAPTFIVEGIGPARFRSHFLLLENEITLDLFTAEINVVALPDDSTPGETTGIPLAQLLGKKIVALARDGVSSSVVILEGGVCLRDANDGFYGNPLVASVLREQYSDEELAELVDYWTGTPLF